jgi:hypothetical protein
VQKKELVGAGSSMGLQQLKGVDGSQAKYAKNYKKSKKNYFKHIHTNSAKSISTK